MDVKANRLPDELLGLLARVASGGDAGEGGRSIPLRSARTPRSRCSTGLLRQTGLAQDARQWAGLRRVAELAVDTTLHNLLPAILLQQADHFTDLHEAERRDGLCQRMEAGLIQARTRFCTSAKFEYECPRPP